MQVKCERGSIVIKMMEGMDYREVTELTRL